MSMHRNSFIGASHAARLQRKYSIVNFYYVAIIMATAFNWSSGFLGEDGALLFSFGVAAIVIYFLGTIYFLVAAVSANTVAFIWLVIKIITSPHSDSFAQSLVMIFMAFGLWLFLLSLLWFSNNYYTYLRGYTEKEIENLYNK